MKIENRLLSGLLIVAFMLFLLATLFEQAILNHIGLIVLIIYALVDIFFVRRLNFIFYFVLFLIVYMIYQLI